MVKLGDLEVFNQLYKNIDFLLVPLYILAHTYYLHSPYWMVFSAVIYIIGIIYFELIFVSIVFISYFASDLLINQRVLRSSDANTRNYAIIALTVVFSVFMITLVTGGIEPYQGAIAFLTFYILQARYRTSTLTIARISEINEKLGLG
tara:strand:- start:651 stop:1094 length:444 start_codon:yes stop_codon:yes gene_type:complete